MRQSWLGVIAVVAGTALVAAGCDTPNSSPVQTVVAPRASSPTSILKLLEGLGGGETQMAVIGRFGGKINVGPNSLVVPRNAVSNPTLFVFTLKSKPYIAADLTAWDLTTGAPVTTFKVKLELTLSYANAVTPMQDKSRVVMYWILNGTPVEGQPTNPDLKGKKVTAQINHFTDYGPVDIDSNDNAPSGPPTQF